MLASNIRFRRLSADQCWCGGFSIGKWFTRYSWRESDRPLSAATIFEWYEPGLHPVAQAVLERYGSDDQVFSRWVAGITGGVMADSLADWVERRAEYAEKFLGSPIEAVRRWAEGEIGFSTEHAADFRLSEEERF